MPNPIPLEKERCVKRLLKRGEKNLSRIARQAGCNRQTVRAIRDGRRVARKAVDCGPKSIPPRICRGCSAVAGYAVYISLEPCVACAARTKRDVMVASITKT